MEQIATRDVDQGLGSPTNRRRATRHRKTAQELTVPNSDLISCTWRRIGSPWRGLDGESERLIRGNAMGVGGR